MCSVENRNLALGRRLLMRRIPSANGREAGWGKWRWRFARHRHFLFLGEREGAVLYHLALLLMFGQPNSNTDPREARELETACATGRQPKCKAGGRFRTRFLSGANSIGWATGRLNSRGRRAVAKRRRISIGRNVSVMHSSEKARREAVSARPHLVPHWARD